MDLTQVLRRSITGYIFLLPGLALYFLLLKKHGKRQTAAHVAAAFIFCYYLIGVLTMTGIGKLKAFAPKFVFVPFLEMLGGPADALLNVLLFIPLGFFLALLYRRYGRPGQVALAGFLLSLSVELLQMFGRGATDVNDLIANTFGACLGYWLYRAASGADRGNLRGQFQAARISDLGEFLFFTLYAFVVMATVQPYVVSRLFRLG